MAAMTDISIAYINNYNKYITDALYRGNMFPKVPVKGSKIDYTRGGLDVVSNSNMNNWSKTKDSTVKVALTTANTSVTNFNRTWDTTSTGNMVSWTTGPIVIGGGYSTSASGYITGYSIYDNSKKEGTMNVKAGFAAVKGGFLALIYNGSIVVWESRKRFKTADKAVAAANKKIERSLDDLFN